MARRHAEHGVRMLGGGRVCEVKAVVAPEGSPRSVRSPIAGCVTAERCRLAVVFVDNVDTRAYVWKISLLRERETMHTRPRIPIDIIDKARLWRRFSSSLCRQHKEGRAAWRRRIRSASAHERWGAGRRGANSPTVSGERGSPASLFKGGAT